MSPIKVRSCQTSFLSGKCKSSEIPDFICLNNSEVSPKLDMADQGGFGWIRFEDSQIVNCLCDGCEGCRLRADGWRLNICDKDFSLFFLNLNLNKEYDCLEKTTNLHRAKKN